MRLHKQRVHSGRYSLLRRRVYVEIQILRSSAAAKKLSLDNMLSTQTLGLFSFIIGHGSFAEFIETAIETALLAAAIR